MNREEQFSGKVCMCVCVCLWKPDRQRSFSAPKQIAGVSSLWGPGGCIVPHAVTFNSVSEDGPSRVEGFGRGLRGSQEREGEFDDNLFLASVLNIHELLINQLDLHSLIHSFT